MNNYQLPNPHRRQFIISGSSFYLNKNWKSYQLGDRYWLSYCSDLNICRSKDRNGISWCLLGLAVHTQAHIEPASEINNLSTMEVIDAYYSWAGRWLLIGKDRIHLDANGLLGCFYGKDDLGNVVVSSSPVLLARVLGIKAKDDRLLTYGEGISWYTPPFSGFIGIKRLLASQILDFTSGEIKPRPLMPQIKPE